jgi:hypothetical protein
VAQRGCAVSEAAEQFGVTATATERYGLPGDSHNQRCSSKLWIAGLDNIAKDFEIF